MIEDRVSKFELRGTVNLHLHGTVLEVSRNIFASVDENAEINVTMNTTGICQWC